VAPTYYIIELSARWLTVLLVALALVMVLAFAFGYGAAWSVLSGDRVPPSPAAVSAVGSPTPEVIPEEVVPGPTRAATLASTDAPTATPTADPFPTTPPAPTTLPEGDEFWVQVLASSSVEAVERAGRRLETLGFGADNQQVATVQVAGGNVLYKLRVGPFPDRESADRVLRRMRSSGFPDAWVVVP